MHALARPDDGSPSGGDDVAEHDRVAGDDGDHQAGRGLVLERLEAGAIESSRAPRGDRPEAAWTVPDLVDTWS